MFSSCVLITLGMISATSSASIMKMEYGLVTGRFERKFLAGKLWLQYFFGGHCCEDMVGL